MKIQTQKKKLQSFLGLVNQVREYIPKLAEHLKPLHKKLKKDVEYYFDNKDKEHIRHIKNLCKKLPKLYFPNENKLFTYIVETDSSNHSYGGVLKYKYDKEKIEHHCRYHSGSYTKAQLKWEINTNWGGGGGSGIQKKKELLEKTYLIMRESPPFIQKKTYYFGQVTDTTLST